MHLVDGGTFTLTRARDRIPILYPSLWYMRNYKRDPSSNCCGNKIRRCKILVARYENLGLSARKASSLECVQQEQSFKTRVSIF